MIFVLVVLALIILGFPRILTEIYSRPRIYEADNAPSAPVASVFGAGLKWDGTPSPVLQDRVATAVKLYQTGKVKKILVSGDNRFLDYNEPGAMYSYAVRMGVPPEDVIPDFAGSRTYDTCYRAKAIFGVTEALLVTQEFHLPRAIYTCNILGLHAVGVRADLRAYMFYTLNVWRLREIPATLTALWDLWVSHPEPVLGDPEPIFPNFDLSKK